MKCQGYLEPCGNEATMDTDFCDACGDAMDFDVASDLFKDDHGVRPNHWMDVNEAREYLNNRNEMAYAEDAHLDEWGDEVQLEV